MAHETILVVDDEHLSRALLDSQLQQWGYRTLVAESGSRAIRLLQEQHVDLVICDLVMPDIDGMRVLSYTRDLLPDLPFIMLSAQSSVGVAVASLRQGATDYLQKPFEAPELRASVERSLRQRQQPAGEARPCERPPGQYRFQQIASGTPAMISVLQMAEQVAAFPQTPVALYGESGVGKEVLARAIHAAGGLKEESFVAVNCAGIPATLLESELFGHVRGAFTGAERDREGMFCLARKGTLLLDEIGDMPLELQAKILRVLQERCYTPLGSHRQLKADFRIIAATHHDLKQLVRRGRFRPDLYHRINAFPIHIPPLRERKAEIPLLAYQFLDNLRREIGKSLPGISRQGMDFLMCYDWPGNIRELKNSLERAAIMAPDHEIITPAHLAFLRGAPPGAETARRRSLSGGGEEPFELHLHLTMEPGEFSLQAVVEKVLELTLERCGNNKSLAAQILKTDRRVFYRNRKAFRIREKT